jgi:hypothetical protein
MRVRRNLRRVDMTRRVLAPVLLLTAAFLATAPAAHADCPPYVDVIVQPLGLC